MHCMRIANEIVKCNFLLFHFSSSRFLSFLLSILRMFVIISSSITSITDPLYWNRLIIWRRIMLRFCLFITVYEWQMVDTLVWSKRFTCKFLYARIYRPPWNHSIFFFLGFVEILSFEFSSELTL